MSAGRNIGSIAVAIVAFLSVEVSAGEATSEVTSQDSLRGEVQGLLDNWVAKYEQPGASAAYVLPDGSAYGVASGWADREMGHPMTADTRMHAGSHPKSYTAATALALHFEGKLDLDAPVSRYVGDMSWFKHMPNHKEVTLRHLLDMTAGIGGNLYTPAALEGHWTDYMPEHGYAYLLRTMVHQLEALAPVGQRPFTYTDTQYILAGVVIEQASGEKIEEAFHRRFVYPLRLTHTEPADRSVISGLAKGYTDASTKGRGVAAWQDEVMTEGVLDINFGYPFTSGHYVSTSRDIARWLWHFYSGRAMDWPYLRERELYPLSNPGLPELGLVDIGYGLGMHAYRHDTLGELHCHDGGMPGYMTLGCYLPDYDIAIAAQSNRRASTVEGPRRNELRLAIAHAVVESLSTPVE